MSLTDGTVFVAQRIEVRPSNKYGEYVMFDGEDLDGGEFHAYSTSGVVLQQAKALLEKYGGENGALCLLITIGRCNKLWQKRYEG